MEGEYPDDWDTRRREVYRRDSYECQNCGSQGGYNGDTELHAHHIVPKSRGGTHKKSNLVTVCHDCHSKIHGYPIGESKNTARPEVEIEIEKSHVYVALAILAFILPLIVLESALTEALSHSFLNSLGVIAAIGISGYIWWVSVSRLTPLLEN